MTGKSLKTYDLERFVRAQAPVIETVLRELREGRKRTHWMWFVFPQLRGLGRSAMARTFGIESLAEARAFLADVELGPRLLACTESVLAIEGRPFSEIFGSHDDLNCSSMSLFARAARPGEPAFQRALDRYCDGRADARTLALLEAEADEFGCVFVPRQSGNSQTRQQPHR